MTETASEIPANWRDLQKAYADAFKSYRNTQTPYPLKRLRTKKPPPGKLPISDSEDG